MNSNVKERKIQFTTEAHTRRKLEQSLYELDRIRGYGVGLIAGKKFIKKVGGYYEICKDGKCRKATHQEEVELKKLHKKLF